MTEFVETKRSKGRFKVDINTKSLYDSYISNLKPVESIEGGMTLGSYDIKQKLYSDILKDLNSSIVQTIILENFEFKLPYNLGRLSMVQKPLKYKLDEKGELITKYLSVDWKATKDLWKSNEEALKNKNLIFHTNKHTNGNRMSYRWSKKGCAVTGMKAYYFLACREVKRAPSSFLKDPELKLCYFEPPLKKTELYMKSLNLK